MPRGSNFKRPYPPEFRREADELYRRSDRPLREIAVDLGVSTETLLPIAGRKTPDAIGPISGVRPQVPFPSGPRTIIDASRKEAVRDAMRPNWGAVDRYRSRMAQDRPSGWPTSLLAHGPDRAVEVIDAAQRLQRGRSAAKSNPSNDYTRETCERGNRYPKV